MTAIFHTHGFLQSPGIVHGFFGREGGVSAGLYRGLNCGAGSKDNPDHVAQNRARVTQALGAPPDSLTTLYQIHSPTVITLHEPLKTAPPPAADGMVTGVAGLVLGILTADCGPVLFADPAARVIGAAHAGWKGAQGGVLENTIAAMEALGAKRAAIAAVIGPAIAQASYEVGPEFVARFDPEDRRQFFIPSGTPGHHRFDLPAYIAHRLARAGLRRVAILGMDTASDPPGFFSYRRATLARKPDYGRQISAIGLT